MLEMKSIDSSQYLRNLVYDSGGNTVISSGTLDFQTNTSTVALNLRGDGRVSMPAYYSLDTSPSPPNIFIASGGRLYKSTATTYTAEEVDTKLAVKDKIIEKLEARLTKLEARIK